MIDPETYLARIGLTDRPAGAQGLRDMQAAHMAHVVFENVGPFLGGVPSLTPEAVYEKVVGRNRGGYCFELNGIFQLILNEVGFRPTSVLARVRNGADEGGARTHQALIVPQDGKDWLVDVGFGGPGAVWPLDLGDPSPQTVANGTYRLRTEDLSGETVLEVARGQNWFALYGFDRVPVRQVDIEAANHLAATWRKAPFSTHLMLARHGADGHVTLFNRRLRVGEAIRLLANSAELADVIRNRFSMPLPDETIDVLWARIRDLPVERPA